MNSDKLSVIFLNLFIISFPLSVTASQSFAIVSTFLFLYSSYSNQNLIVVLKNRMFLTAFGIYLGLIPALLWNLPEYDLSLLSILTRSEISDFWMCFVILPAFYHIRKAEYRNGIFYCIYFAIFLLVLSGVISIFTPFRLASFIAAGFQIKEGARLQHFAGDFWGRYTYLPIGLMNTHLTFGGLCGLFFSGTLFHFLFTLKNRKIWKNVLLLVFCILFAVVVFFNQSRSVWLGVIFTFGLIIIKLIRSLEIKNNYFQWKYFLITIGILVVFAGATLSIYKKNWLLQRAFQEGLADNTTENQRYFIYKNTLSLIQNHPILGIGPGRFSKEHNVFSNAMISKNEQLWYELFITPRQHAHHDPLHFFAIGGILGLALVLHFWFYLIRLFLKSPLTSHVVLFSGVLTIFIAGFFQCYMLDDEVVLPFFALIGLFAGSVESSDKKSKFILGIQPRSEMNQNDSFQVELISIESSFLSLKNHLALHSWNSLFKDLNLYTLSILIIPICLSFTYTIYKTRLDPIDVYKRKVTVSYPEDRILIFKSLKQEFVNYPTSHMTKNDFIRIEGCLSHRFTDPISIRKEPFQIVLRSPVSAKNPPTSVKITVKERDAFDQDQLYKVHGVRDIGDEYFFPLSSSEPTKISLGGSELFQFVKDSNRFPENIYFRDFVFQFSGFDPMEEYFDLPLIDFGDLCDAK